MTTTPASFNLLDFITDAMLEGEIDFLETLESARPILSHDAFLALCASIDACPIHLNDLDTCRDDDRHCYDD